MRTTRRSSLPRCVRSDWLYARMDGGVECGRRGGRPSRAMCVATGFMPGWMAGLSADDAEVVPPALFVRSDWLYARTDRGVTMRTTRRSSLPRCAGSDWLYARMNRGVAMRTTRRSSLPRGVCVATGFMPGWMAGLSADDAEVVPPARCVRSDWLYARKDHGD